MRLHLSVNKLLVAFSATVVFTILMLLQGYAANSPTIVAIVDGKEYAYGESLGLLEPGTTVTVRFEARDKNTGQKLKAYRDSGSYVSIDPDFYTYPFYSDYYADYYSLITPQIVSSDSYSQTVRFTIPKPFGNARDKFAQIHMFVRGYCMVDYSGGSYLSTYFNLKFDTMTGEQKRYSLSSDVPVPKVLRAGESKVIDFFVTDQFGVKGDVYIDWIFYPKPDAPTEVLNVSGTGWSDVTFTAGEEVDQVYTVNVNIQMMYEDESYVRHDLNQSYDVMVVPADWVEPDPPEKPQPNEPSDSKDIYGNKIISLSQKEKQITSQKTDNDVAGSTYSLLQLRASKVTAKSVQLKWKKVKGASKYVIYGNKCGRKNRCVKIKEVKGTSYTQKKLKKGTYYKYIVVAEGNGMALATSKTVHAATKGGKIGNSKAVKVNKRSVTLKPKKTFKIKASAVAQSKKLKVKKHRGLAFESSNPKVATVTNKGVIKGVSAGKCKIYVYAQNGVSKAISVTVKK